MSAMAYAVFRRQTLEHAARAVGVLLAWLRSFRRSKREANALGRQGPHFAWPARHPAEMALLLQQARAHGHRATRVSAGQEPLLFDGEVAVLHWTSATG